MEDFYHYARYNIAVDVFLLLEEICTIKSLLHLQKMHPITHKRKLEPPLGARPRYQPSTTPHSSTKSKGYDCAL